MPAAPLSAVTVQVEGQVSPVPVPVELCAHLATAAEFVFSMVCGVVALPQRFRFNALAVSSPVKAR